MLRITATALNPKKRDACRVQVFTDSTFAHKAIKSDIVLNNLNAREGWTPGTTRGAEKFGTLPTHSAIIPRIPWPMANQDLKSLDEYEVFLTEKMTPWSPQQRVASVAAIAEYWLPAYESFSAEEDWGDPASLAGNSWRVRMIFPTSLCTA
jgi:hypothetical protein